MSQEIHDLLQKTVDRYILTSGKYPGLGKLAPDVYRALVESIPIERRECFANGDLNWNGIPVRMDLDAPAGYAYFSEEES